VKSNEPPEFKPTNWYDLPLEVGMDPAGSLCTPPHDAASQDLLAQHNKMSIEDLSVRLQRKLQEDTLKELFCPFQQNSTDMT
jgi:hypothetical protein